MRYATLFVLFLHATHAQWTLQTSGTTAHLRGIDHVGAGIAWASGTNGTILRTTDNGATWLRCAVPTDAGDLDFRGIQAFDRETAIVMSSGTGEKSRLYRTTDACRSWTSVLSNPDPTGFWDAIRFADRRSGVVIGDPVDGAIPLFVTSDGGTTWRRVSVPATAERQALFAASNTELLYEAINSSTNDVWFVTGGGTTTLLHVDLSTARTKGASAAPLAMGEAAGGFSLAARRR